MPGPISIVRDLKTLLAVSGPAVHLVPRTFETIRHNCFIGISCHQQPLILLASDTARCKALVIRRASHTRHRSERGTIRSAHDWRSFGRLMHGSSPFLRLGWLVGIGPAISALPVQCLTARPQPLIMWLREGDSNPPDLPGSSSRVSPCRLTTFAASPFDVALRDLRMSRTVWVVAVMMTSFNVEGKEDEIQFSGTLLTGIAEMANNGI